MTDSPHASRWPSLLNSTPAIPSVCPRDWDTAAKDRMPEDPWGASFYPSQPCKARVLYSSTVVLPEMELDESPEKTARSSRSARACVCPPAPFMLLGGDSHKKTPSICGLHGPVPPLPSGGGS